MAVLTDKNLSTYKELLDKLENEVKKWRILLDNASKHLNSSTGSYFRANYAVGKKATTNIQAIIDSLIPLQSDLYKLVGSAKVYYSVSKKAAKK